MMRPSMIIANGTIVAAAVVWLAVVAISLTQPFRAAPIPAAQEHPETAETLSAFQRGWYGFVMRLDGAHELEQFNTALDEIAAMNANAVLIETPILQNNPNALEVTLHGDECPLLTDIVAVIHHASEQGLAVVLVPSLVFHENKAGQARSGFAPADWDRWWLSYEEAVLHLAEIAESAGAEVFAVGSELSESEVRTAQWTNLLSQVRSHYAGLIMYNAQWDKAPRIAFWEFVDLIGVSAWFPLVSGNDEPPEALDRRWRESLEEVDLLSARAERPVLLSAVGYPSRASGLLEPWNADPEANEVPSESVQSAAIAAFLKGYESLDPRYPRHAGFFIYRWGIGTDAANDPLSHVVKDKPAETMLRDALGRLTGRKNEQP